MFRVEVGPQQLEECLRLSICTPLETLDPRLDELLRVSGVCWQELALRLRDIYADQLREFQFQEEDENSSHLLLLCPDTFDLIIHLTFITPKDQAVAQPGTADDGDVSASGDGSIDSSSRSASINGSHVGSVSEQFSDGGFEAEVQGDVRVEICRREEPPNKQFTFAQRRSISEFVNCIVHWQWRSLIYD
ncbi:SZT2 protein [Phytophthora cinnamomi]|uniref:SZT2 protein n=1 Tax=Phytophthora cinnamomi TaxID=4785 RepID=UPI00355A8714|nr:SZT2 protein [Phytophthora cinnamomi]